MRVANVGKQFYVGRAHLGNYMRRWLIQTPWFTIRLHHIMRPDSGRDHHDHPWDFISFILWGGYVEALPCDCKWWTDRPHARMRTHLFGRKVKHRAEDLHTITTVATGGAWTLVFTGPRRREWGFQTPEGWVPWREYKNYDEQLGEEDDV